MKTSLLLELKIQTSEKMTMPTIFLNNKVFKLFATIAQEKSSGDEYLIAEPIKGECFLIKIGWEPDCDGSYYYTYFVEDFEIETEDFDIFESDCFSKIMYNHFIN